MMKLLGAVFVTGALVGGGASGAGCGGAQGGGVQESANALALEREVTGWYTRWSEALGAGEMKRVAQAFAPQGFYVGVHPDEALVGPLAITSKARRPGGVGGDTASSALTVAVSSDGLAAWISDLDGAKPSRRTTVLVERSGTSWHALVAHVSNGVAPEIARKKEEEGGFVPLADVGDQIAPEAQPLAQLLSQALGGADKFTAIISKRPGTLAFGPAPDDHFTGTHEVSEWVRSLYSREGSRVVRNGGMRAGLAVGGTFGWVATNVDLIVQRGVRELTRPCRFTAVFAREGDGWAIVHLHLSHAPKDQD